jgi:peroxiredoxin
MKTLRIVGVVFALAGLLVPLAPAQSSSSKAAPKKSPADIAMEDFFKLRDKQDAKLGQDHYFKIMTDGLAALSQHAAHWRAPQVVSSLATYGISTMRDKSQEALRSWWLSTLRFETVKASQRDGLSNDAKAALQALLTAIAGVEVRAAPGRDAMDAFREKINDLAAVPGGNRFVLDQEKVYAGYLAPAAAEAHLRKLEKHPEKSVAGWAAGELVLIGMKRTPLEWKFTALDGREVDVANARGKILVLLFWATTNSGSVNELNAAQEALSFFRKKPVEVIAVSCDKEANKEKLLKFVKDEKVVWPVHFDGKEFKNDLCTKLGVRSVPALALFDQKGLLASPSRRANQLEGDLNRLLGGK